MLKLWLVRHGQTDWNVARLIQGWTDIPLNSTGQKQARALHHYISGIRFHEIFSSDLIRAYETAQILSGNCPEKIKKVEFLRERCFGIAEGRPRSELDTIFTIDPPRSEPKRSVILRGKNFLDMVTSEYSSGRYLCVAHGGLIRAILEYLDVRDEPALTNTSVTVLEQIGQNWIVQCVNWHQHLSEEKNTPTAAYVQTETRVH
jgi:broad specificity phosphatase PhoE